MLQILIYIAMVYVMSCLLTGFIFALFELLLNLFIGEGFLYLEALDTFFIVAIFRTSILSGSYLKEKALNLFQTKRLFL
jgi:hypothetical protein